MTMREPATIYVCNVMGDVLYPLDNIEKEDASLKRQLNGQSELSFTYTKGKNDDDAAYDVLEEGMYLYVEDVGHFKMRQPVVRIDSATESKTITAYSCDVEFEDKTITMPVNMGTETSLEFLLNNGKQELPYIWTDVDGLKHAGFELLRDPYTMKPYDWIILYNKYVDQLEEYRTWYLDWSAEQTADADGRVTIANGYHGYYDSVEDKFYKDAEKTIEYPKGDGLFYVDLENEHTYMFCSTQKRTEHQTENGVEEVSSEELSGVNPKAYGWYEENVFGYILTEDEEVVNGKTYYKPKTDLFMWAEAYDAYDVVDEDSFNKCKAMLDQIPRLVSRTEHEGSVEGYYDETLDKFYEDSAKTFELDKVDGQFYIDMTLVDGEPSLVMYRWEHDKTSDNPYAGSFVFAESYSNADVVTVENILDVSTVDYAYHQYVFKTENNTHEVTAFSFGDDFEQRICMLVGYYTKYGAQLSLLDILCAQVNNAWVPGNIYGLQNDPKDYTLANQKMQFDIDETIYSFLASTYAQWSKCLVTFDILNRRINITPVEYVGEDTGVVLSYDQLLNTLNINSTEDTLATRLTIIGGDDLSIEQVNFGEDQVVDIAYKLNARDSRGRRIYVSDELAEKYARYEKVRERLRTGKAGLEKYAETLDPESEEYAEVQAELDAWTDNTEGYCELSKKRNEINAELYELKYRVPADSVHENWDQYNEKELSNMLKTYSNKLHTLEQLYAEDYGLEHQSNYDPWVEITAGSNYPIPDWIPERNDYPYMMPRVEFIQNTIYWWDYVAYQQTLTQIGIAMQARFESDPVYLYSGIKGTSEDEDVREQYKRITAYETEWSLYGSVEMQAKIGAYDAQLQAMIDGNAIEVKHRTWDNLAIMPREEVDTSLEIVSNGELSGANPKLCGWYEPSMYGFILTEDEEVDNDKFYYKGNFASINPTTDKLIVKNIDIQKRKLSVLIRGRSALDSSSDHYQRQYEAFTKNINEQINTIRLISSDSTSEQIYVLSTDTTIDTNTYTVTIDGITSSFYMRYYTSLQTCFDDSTGASFEQACDVLKKKKEWDSLETTEQEYFLNSNAYYALVSSNITTKEAIVWNELTDEQRQKHGNTEANYPYDAYQEIYNNKTDAQEYLDTVIMPEVYEKEDALDVVQRARDMVAQNARLATYHNPTNGDYYGEYFSDYELKVLSLLMRDAEYTNEYIFTTSLQNTVEAVDKMEELYQDAIEQVRTFSRPQLTFEAEIDNLMALPEFHSWNSDFKLGNYIYVEYRDGEYARVRMVGMTYNPCIVGSEQMDVEFSNITYTKTKVSDVESVLGMAATTTSSGGGGNGGGSGSSAAWDEVYALLSSSMIKRLLSPETFIQEVTRVVANKVVKRSLTTKEQIYDSLVKGLADVSGACLSAGIIRSEAENAYGQPISWFNLDDGTFSYGDGALMFHFDGTNYSGEPVAWLTVSGEVDATSGNIGGVQIGDPYYDTNHDPLDYCNRLWIGEHGLYYRGVTGQPIHDTKFLWFGLDTNRNKYSLYMQTYDYYDLNSTMANDMKTQCYTEYTAQQLLFSYAEYDQNTHLVSHGHTITLNAKTGAVNATGGFVGGSSSVDGWLSVTGNIYGDSVSATNGVSGASVSATGTVSGATVSSSGKISGRYGYFGSSSTYNTSDGDCTASYYYGSATHMTGKDYAEYFEWLDGNPLNIDRRGRFVTTDGEKIRLATEKDIYILGIITGTPTVLGNTAWDCWHDKYLRDEFGAIITEPVQYPAVTDEEGNIVEEAYVQYEPVINPEYDPTMEYIPREQRPEWAPVGLVGQIIMLDDGTCEVNGFAKSADEGIATKADGITSYRVIKRIDDHHIVVAAK